VVLPEMFTTGFTMQPKLLSQYDENNTWTSTESQKNV
jgi:predicted amidohydrolase